MEDPPGTPRTIYDEKKEMKVAPYLPYDDFMESLDNPALRNKLLNETFGEETALALADLNEKSALNVIQNVINEIDNIITKNEKELESFEEFLESFRGSEQFLSVFDENLLIFQIDSLNKDITEMEKIIKRKTQQKESWENLLAGYEAKLTEEQAILDKLKAQGKPQWMGPFNNLKAKYKKLQRTIDGLNTKEEEKTEGKKSKLTKLKKKLKKNTVLKKLKQKEEDLNILYDKLSKLIALQAFILNPKREEIADKVAHSEDMVAYLNGLLDNRKAEYSVKELERRKRFHENMLKKYSIVGKASKILEMVKPANKPNKKARLETNERKKKITRSQLQNKNEFITKRKTLNDEIAKLFRTTKLPHIRAKPLPKRKLQLRF